MSRITVDEIQARVASVVDENPVTTDISATTYALRLKYINMALTEWGDLMDWQSLYKEYNCLVSTSTGNASVALPTDFRKIASFPLITHDGVTTAAFPETRPQEASKYLSTDKRVEVLGNFGNNYTLRIYGATLVSGASVKVPYYASPQSLATSSDIPMIPNPDFLVNRTIHYWYAARGDSRSQEFKNTADIQLRNLIEREEVFSEASTNDRIRPVEETRYNFRLGRD